MKKLVEFDFGLQKMERRLERRSVLSSRDSVRQVEALLQIFRDFPVTKQPMPSTGGSAIDAQALSHLIELFRSRRPKTILELGSGTSTVWLSYLCREFGARLVSLDHLEKFLGLTSEALARHKVSTHTDLRLAPLEEIVISGETYNWYSSKSISDLSEIDMLIVDGPPAQTGPQARFPALPVLIDRLASSACVILDDANREEEQQIMESWMSLYGEFKQVEVGVSRLAVLERKKDS